MNTILVVDSDGKALTAAHRRLRRNFETHIALGARSGLQRLVEEGPYAAVIAEFSMADMDGIEFLARVRTVSPQTSRILLSRTSMGVADLLRAVNEAGVFHVLPASCDDQPLLDAVGKGVRQYEEMWTSSRDMRDTCALFAKAVHEIVCWLRADLRDLLSSVLPLLRGLCQRLNDPDPVLTETAFLASVVGFIALPAQTLDAVVSGRELGDAQKLAFAGHPEHAVELLRHIPKMRDVAEILRGYSNFLHLSLMPASDDATDMPDMPCGSPILALVMEYRMSLFENLPTAAFMERMRERGLYASSMLQALEAQIAASDQAETPVGLEALQPGMVLARPVTGTRDGKSMVLAPEGYELSRTTILFIRQTARNGHVDEPVMVKGGGTPRNTDQTES
ncbi:HD domain-containing phosphohydrolase [Desulfomicrobium escambiense]|uniref:HD domain-containing phosphohydrolase n=1 Tax=Desulfomicrobium escambiense TaxID=29503 RepID=UPI0003FD6464|nr:HD domain-containing phosphohydrolase [Desulfomicrobium escambiense]